MNYGVLFALVLSMNAAACFAESAEWRRYLIPSTGTNVDIPVSIFTEDAGAPEGGTGRRFFTQDHRADLHNPVRSKPGQRFAGGISAEEAPPSGHSIQACNSPLLRCV